MRPYLLLLIAACGHDPAQTTTTSAIACETPVTFPVVPSPATGSGATAIATADLDGDGRADLVTANVFDNSISVLRGRGDGSFADRIDVPTGASPQHLVIGDITGDGVTDVVTLGDSSLDVLAGAAGGSLSAAVSYPLPAHPRDLALVDVDGDGRRDAVVVSGSTLQVLRALPDGTLAAPVASAADRGLDRVALADLDGDGVVDAVATTDEITHSTVTVFHGNGDGTFAVRASLPIGAGTYLIALADLDGDGAIDLAVTSTGTNTLTVARGHGDGTFAAGTDYALNTFVNGPAGSLAVADLDGNGTLDLVVSSGPDGLQVLSGDGHGGFAMSAVTLPIFGASSSAVADFDGDGALDLAFVDQSSVAAIVLATAPGAFPSTDIFAVPATNQHALALADVDGDGIPDVFQVSTNGDAMFSHGVGDQTFAAPVALAGGNPATAVALGDVDGDGFLDAVAAGSAGLYALRGDGAGNFAAQPLAAGPGGLDPRTVTLADLDGDGVLDAVTGEGTVYRGHGDGTFAAGLAVVSPNNAFDTVVADFDGDGALDLAISDPLGHAVRIFKGGDFSASVAIDIGAFVSGLDAADLDGDGRPDLIASLPEVHAVATLKNVGALAFAPRTDYPAGDGPYAIIHAQLTAAAHPAFAVLDMDGAISVFVADATGALGPRTVYASGLLPLSVAIADLDGDHLPDLVVDGPLHGLVLPGQCSP